MSMVEISKRKWIYAIALPLPENNKHYRWGTNARNSQVNFICLRMQEGNTSKLVKNLSLFITDREINSIKTDYGHLTVVWAVILLWTHMERFKIFLI